MTVWSVANDPPEFRAYGGRINRPPDYNAMFRGHTFIIHYSPPGLYRGDPGDYWVLWHHDPDFERPYAIPENRLTWPARCAGGVFGCTGTYDTLEEAKAAVLTICATIQACDDDGSNVVPFRRPSA